MNLTYIIATKTIGKTNARKTVVILGRTRVISRFLTVNVHTCLKKRLIVAASFGNNLGEDPEEASTARQGIIISRLSFVLTPGVAVTRPKRLAPIGIGSDRAWRLRLSPFQL